MTLSDLRDSWDEWGKKDPLWVILSDPEKKDGRWDLDEFFATGPREVAALLGKVAELGVEIGRGRALDFGCGVGRVTQALCEHFDECVGVDIAPSMIDTAEQHNRFPGRCRYLVNTTGDLGLFPADHFDLVYCKLVLQHMEPALARGYVAELVRVLAAGGLLVFQAPSELVSSGMRSSGVPSRSLRERALGALARLTRDDDVGSGGSAEHAPNVVMHGMPRSGVLDVLERRGGRPVSVEEDGLAGPAWRSYTYYVTK
jgi:SAM-dependent methyltransferase